MSDNKFEIRKSELQEFKGWIKEAFKLMFRNPMFSVFGFIITGCLLFSISLSIPQVLFLGIALILLPVLNFYSLYLNDTSGNIKDININLFKLVPINYVLFFVLIVFFTIIGEVFNHFFPSTHSETESESSNLAGASLFIIMTFVTFILSLISSFLFFCVSANHYLKYLPVQFLDINPIKDINVFFAYHDTTDEGYHLNFFNFLFIGTIICAIIFGISFMLNLPSFFVLCFVSIGFYFLNSLAYVAAKDLVGAGKIKSKVTESNEIFNLQPAYQENK